MSVRHTIRALALIALASPMLAAGRAEASFQLFGSEFDAPTDFYTIDPNTGATTVIGSTLFSPGMDFRSDGTLFGSSSSLRTINTANGAVTTIGTLPDLLVSIAFNPAGELWGVNNDGDTLFQIDPATGASLGSVTLSTNSINGIDFAPDGTLYGIGFDLFSINTSTGLASQITPSGQNVSGNNLFLDLDYGPDGLLRSSNFVSAANGSSGLYEIDPTTGLGSLVGLMGLEGNGIASMGVIPEPGSMTLLGLGLAALAVVGRSARRRSA